MSWPSIDRLKSWGGWRRNGHPRRQIYLQMDLTSTCGLRCRHCFRTVIKLPRYTMTQAQIRILGKEVFPWVNRLALSETGEILGLPILDEALSTASEAGIPFVRIQTNGVQLDEKVGKVLLDNGLSALGISVDAASAQTYESIRRGGSFEEVIQNIRSFVQLRNRHPSPKTSIALNFVLCTPNAEETLDFLLLAKELGVDSVAFSHLMIESEEMRKWSLIYDPATANSLHADIRRRSYELRIPIALPPDLPSGIRMHTPDKMPDLGFWAYCEAAHDN
ncbi:MAG: radical SAM protein [Candidatus Omnitrophica bacterium]|nr:radical SAM protein [Candidatus Omnitrophota bacterium]